MSQSEYELELEPNEQLDELTRRSNADGTVDVPIVGWEKNERRDVVEVSFRRPDGRVETEVMDWPTHATDMSFKFVRLVEETPYTMATADELRGDTQVEVAADPSDWSLALPTPTPLAERVRERTGVSNLWVAFVALSWVSIMAVLTLVIVVMAL